ncbi:MAG: acetate--CoA ligase family protein [Proteobacteria bacterium]|nr:acetate--CoA ligase family protein [Pseudomonadota bacterium]
MQLREFQGKDLLSRYAIAVPEGRLAASADEAAAAASALRPGNIYVKAQILAGDRAAAGGVRAVSSALAAAEAARQMLASPLVTPQTGPAGQAAAQVLVERGVQVAREFYIAIGVDPARAAIELVAGSGGSGIEQRIARGSETLSDLQVGTRLDGRAADIDVLGRRIGVPEVAAGAFRATVERLHRAFVELDASLIEVNPLVLTPAGDFVAVDAKVELDDNAGFRHPEFAAMAGEPEGDLTELKAQQSQINFIQMDGDIGAVVNGAGLGLATLDMIRTAGGKPANFMDIRTTAKSMDVAHGIALLLDNPRVKVLLVNVFGGGMQPCDTVAEALGIAFRKHGRRVPAVIRLTGNNEELARHRLANFEFAKIECADMWQAVTRAVSIAQGRA